MYLMSPTTISTCVILALDDTLLATHFLSVSLIRPLVYLCYSVYLVHWTIFVFSLHLWNSFGFDKPNVLLMVLVILGMAIMLQQCIEDPVRHGDRRWVFGLMTSCTFMFAISMMRTKGFPSRVGNLDTDMFFGSQADRMLQYCESYSKGNPQFTKVHYKTCLVDELKGYRRQDTFVGGSFVIPLVPVLKDVRIRKEWYVTHWKPQFKL